MSLILNSSSSRTKDEIQGNDQGHIKHASSGSLSFEEHFKVCKATLKFEEW